MEQLIDTLERLGTGLPTSLLRVAVAGALPRPHQQRAVTAELADRPDLLATNAARGSHQLVLLAEALLSAGAAAVAPPTCPFCEQRAPIRFRRDGLRCCKRCYEATRARQCARCGQARPVVGRTAEGDALCKACDQREPANFEPCARCGRHALLVPTDAGDRCCRACWRAPISTCSICDRRRPCHGANGPNPRCETCVKRSNTAACERCGNVRVVAARTKRGHPLCQPCAMPREQCVRCQRVRPVVGRPADGPVYGTCWRRHPAATRTCNRCSSTTRLHHFGLCTACACPGVVRDLLTAPDGHLHPAAHTVFDVLSTDDNPAAVLKWLQPTAARTLLTNLAQHTGPLEHALLDRLHPSKAAAWLRAVLVARGALPARDEYLALLERWINNAITTIAAPDDRRLARRFATWHYLRRLRQQSSPEHPTGYGQITVVRSELSAAIALLTWLRKRDTTISNARQTDIDDWLTSGPTSRHGANPFVTWAVRRGHATAINLAAHTGAIHRRVFPRQGQRWHLVRRLLHDANLDTVDRVAGLLVLLYAQPVSRIAMLTVNRIHTDADGTHLRLGNNPIRLPPPLDRLIGNLVHHRAGHTAVARSAASPWLFPGAEPGRPLSAHQLAARLRRLGIPARLARNSALIDLAVQLPAAVLSQLLGIHLQTATAWTIEAGNTRLRYAALAAHLDTT